MYIYTCVYHIMCCGVFVWMNVVFMKLSAVWDDCYGVH